MEEGRREGLDLAIDAAVREMLDVEPRDDLRARIVTRIDARGAASSFQLPAFSFQFPASSFQLPASSFQFPASSLVRFAVLAGGVAVLVFMVLFVRRSELPARPPVVARAVDQQLQADGPARAAADTAAAHSEAVIPIPREAVIVRTTVARAVPGDVAYAASTATSGAPGIDPLKTIAPIQVAPIAQSRIAPEPIDVRPLSPIHEMQIAPLNPPEGRD